MWLSACVPFSFVQHWVGTLMPFSCIARIYYVRGYNTQVDREPKGIISTDSVTRRSRNRTPSRPCDHRGQNEVADESQICVGAYLVIGITASGCSHLIRIKLLFEARLGSSDDSGPQLDSMVGAYRYKQHKSPWHSSGTVSVPCLPY